MRSYSLLEAVYSKSDPIDLVDPNTRLRTLVEQFYVSDYSIDEVGTFASIMCEGDSMFEFSLQEVIRNDVSNILNEAISDKIKDNLGNILQLGLGAVGDVVGVGLGGAVVDTVFFAAGAGDAINAISSFKKDLGNIKEIWENLKNLSVRDTPQQIYDKTKSVLSKVGEIFEKYGINVEKGLEKLRDLFRKLMVKMAKVTGDMVAILVPIPGTDIAIQNAITEFADDAFKTVIKLFDKMPKFIKDIFNNPGEMGNKFKEIVQKGIEFLKGNASEGEEEGGIISSIKGFAKKSAMSIGKIALGPIATLIEKSKEKILDFLENKAPKLIDDGIELYSKLYPAIFGVLSSLTLLQNPKELGIESE